MGTSEKVIRKGRIPITKPSPVTEKIKIPIPQIKPVVKPSPA